MDHQARRIPARQAITRRQWEGCSGLGRQLRFHPPRTGYGAAPNIELNLEVRDDTERRQLLDRFDELWSDTDLTRDVKAEVLSATARDVLRANRRSCIHLFPDDWKKLPIPDVKSKEQAHVVALVDQILADKRADPHADTGATERYARQDGRWEHRPR